jgi:hypothetical protein
MAKPASRSTRTAAKAPARSPAMEAKANEPEPAVMAAGASPENAEQGKGMPPADPPKPEDKVTDESAEGFRNESGQFTGNPPTDAERLDAICDLLEKNGMSLPKVLQRAKE